MNFELLITQNGITNLLMASGVALAAFILFELVRRMLASIFKRKAEVSRFHSFKLLYRIIHKTKIWFLFWISIYIGSLFLDLSESLSFARSYITITLVFLQIGFWVLGLIDYWIEQRSTKEEIAGEQKTTLSIVGVILKIGVWIFVFLIILDNLPGVEITTLIAGLGIGGIAVGLAVQNILSDLFSSVSIALDKPFVIGDTIKVGEFVGTVESIGLKSTRLRSISGEQLIFTNSDLLSSRIQNFKRLERRRVIFSLGVTYETSTENLEKIPRLVEEIISTKPNVTFDRAHFKEFGAFSLNFEIVYYVDTSDFRYFMDVQQEINLEIFRKFNERGIQFAYPTQVIYTRNNSH
jgi:small-conductance mechanosensitive channel